MKMVKSRTRKKSSKSPSKFIPKVVAAELDLAANYIKQWTTRELSKLVCIPVSDGYRIGLYHIRVYPNKTSDLINPNGEFIHRFEGKISAILYTIYTIKKRYSTATDIINLDTEINKNYTDMLNLRRTIAGAIERQDFVTVDIRQNKLEIVEHDLKVARDKLQQIHRTAKFNKVWL
jgi:hypothetical protein